MNKTNFIRFFSLIVVLTISFSSFASPSKNMSDKRKMKKAENLFTYADFEAALPIYMDMLRAAPENWKLNYRIGVCHYYSTTSRPRSVPFFSKAVANSGKDTVPDLLYHAGLAFLCVNEFDKAETMLLSFRKKAGKKYKDQLLDQLISGCATGRQMWNNPNKARITNLGSNVNSAYPDYAPVVIYKSDVLLFTSKRPGNTGNAKDDEGFYYEDVYQAKGESWNRWKTPSRYDTSLVKRRGIFSLLFNKAEIVSEINTEEHDGSITLSPDSTDLYIFRYGDIMKANWDGTNWQRPQRIVAEIDMRASHEPSIFLGRDGKTLLFVSDRKGGVGQKDIWICDKEGTNWGKPHNIGLEVNSPFNEDSPFLSPDGNTLYFSAEGHNSMGGYDVFKCTREKNGSWSKPENLGAPVNNGGDDIFYTPLENGSGAYYSSMNRDGEGDLDLFFIQYFPAVTPMAKLRINASGLAPQAKITIRMTSPEGRELNTFELGSNDSIMYPFAPNTLVNYEISAPEFTTTTSTLNFANKDNDQFALQQLNVSKTNKSVNLELENFYFAIDSAINPSDAYDPFAELPIMRTNYLDSLSDIVSLAVSWSSNSTSSSSMGISTASNSNSIEFATVYFGFNQFEISSIGTIEVQKVALWMKSNPARKIELVGHADEKGEYVYNQRLSEKRANSIKSALTAAGISEKRIVTLGKGESEPATSKQNNGSIESDQGAVNRRVTIRILE